MTPRGRVALVGAGPGDPDLLTVRALRLLQEADVVAYDELVPEAILALAAPHAERLPVGRRAHGVKHHDGVIHDGVIERALRGLFVVRLKCGDPMIFGRGGEEAEAIVAAGLDVDVVPGITAALGAASSALIPLTHRDAAAVVTFATAHRASNDPHWPAELAASLPSSGTLVLYMGASSLDLTASALIEAGRRADTPVAIVSNATWPTEQRLIGTLADIAERARENPPPLPALIIVGDVVGRSTALHAAVTSMHAIDSVQTTAIHDSAGTPRPPQRNSLGDKAQSGCAAELDEGQA